MHSSLLIMAPRKLIGLVISLALITAGIAMCILPFFSDGHLGKIVLVGPLLLAVGGGWIYEDWFV